LRDDKLWSQCDYVGRQEDYDDDGNRADLELRNCTCGSTISRLAPKGNPPKSFRPQKVVGVFQKDTRPTLATKLLSSPVDVVSALNEYMGDRVVEVFLVFFVNVRNQCIGYTELTSLGVAGVEVNTSGILREALLCGAVAFITAHNHPTGNPAPSADDFHLWQRLRDAGTLIGIPVLDNMVIANGRWYSEAEKGGI